MTLAPDVAMDALIDAFNGVADLPEIVRNDYSLASFDESGTAGVKWKFALVVSDPRPLLLEFGEPMSVELDVRGELHFSVEGLDSAAREPVIRAGVAAMKAVMFPAGMALRIDGAFDDLSVNNVRRRLFQDEPGRLPIETFSVSFGLNVTAPTPLG